MKRTLITMGTVALVGVGSIFYTEPVEAQSIAERKANVEQKLNDVEKEIVKTSEKVNEYKEDIGVLENAIKENEDTSKKVERKINTYKSEIDKLKEEILQLEDGIEKRNNILKNRLSAYQKVGGDFNFVEVLLGSVGFDSFISRATAANTIAEADQDLIVQQEEAMQAVEAKQGEVETKLAEQEKEQQKLEEINKQKKEQKEELEKSKRLVEKEIEKLEAKKADYVAEGNDIAALEAQMNQPSPSPSPSSGEATANTSNTSNTSNSGGGGGQKANSNSSTPAANLGGGSNGSAIAAGRSVLGTPYRTAGKGPGGFDCSGFVAWAYQSEGLNLPSYTGALAGVGQRVPSLSQAKPGDLVFFRGGAHVGIYLGNGQFIGSQTSTGVAVADMTSGYWGSTFDGHIRRVK